jgi:hypothetical protein
MQHKVTSTVHTAPVSVYAQYTFLKNKTCGLFESPASWQTPVSQ